MKRLLTVLLVLLLCAVGAAAEGGTPAPEPTPVPDLIAQPDGAPRPIATATPRPEDAPLPEDEFLANTVEIARRLGMMAESGVFFENCNRSNASRECWDAISRGDHTTPSRIFSLSGAELVRGLTGGNAGAIDLTRPELRRDVVSSLPDLMLLGADTEAAQAVRMLARYKVFASDVEDGCGLLVLLYEDATPIVCFWYSDQGAVCICAYFIPDEALERCQSAEDVAAWFATLNMPLVTFEEVTW